MICNFCFGVNSIDESPSININGSFHGFVTQEFVFFEFLELSM